MHEFDLILTLTCGLAAALAFGYITNRLGLSPIVGYLLAGFAVGPRTPGFVANQAMADQFAEVGVILLMFGVGLQFHLSELLAVRRVAIPGAIAQITAATLLGIAVSWAADWGWSAGFVFGLAISVASTVVLLRVLSDNNDLHTPAGHIAVGWLVVEDLFTVLVLVLLPVLFPPAGGGGNVALALVFALVKLTALVGFTFVVGGRVIPWVLGHIAKSHSRELFTLAVLVIALGIAVGSSVVFGASMALGAFLAGMVVGRSDFSLRAASDALPMRDAFAVLFFVSVGMLFEPRILVESPAIVAATLAVILIGKPLAALGIVAVLGYPPRVAIAAAVALAQIGEFSFILSNLGRDLKVIPDVATSALVAAAIISISFNPILYRMRGRIESWLAACPPIWRLLNRGTAVSHALPQTDNDKHRAIVIGYGPVGRTLVRLLRESDISPVVIEMNLNTVQALRSEGIAAVYGDAARPETLMAAGTDRAVAILLTASNVPGAEEVIRQARALNPRIHIAARTAYLREIDPLVAAGADRVFSGEGEVALTFTETLLEQLGASPDQIGRQRELIRDELVGSPPPVVRLAPDDSTSSSA